MRWWTHFGGKSDQRPAAITAAKVTKNVMMIAAANINGIHVTSLNKHVIHLYHT